MNILQAVIHFTEIVLFIYFAFAAVYIFLFSFFSVFKKPDRFRESTYLRKIAVLIPGYKEDNVIVDVAMDALNQDYPKNRFDVVIIADSFQPTTIEALKKLPIKLVEVAFEQSTKSKALNKAMEVIGDEYDIAIVLDADNIMEQGFIHKINNAFESGVKIVQGHRVAKNLNTSFAVLDAVSEELNNSIFRKGHRVLGFSSALIGSGMAFDYAIFKKRMSEIHAIGGFDKELELTFLQDQYLIEYLNDAIVYDEKVQKVEVFEKQRKRWLSAQFVYFGRFFLPGLKDLMLKGNIDFFDKVYQMVTPPRILLLGITALSLTFYFVFNLMYPDSNLLIIPTSFWMYTMLLIVFAFITGIPLKFYNSNTLKAVFTLPKAFISMFLTLFKLKGANKKFIHTQHGSH